MSSINKKGISPLIATVLLVGISIALGAIVMNFTSTSTTELTERTGERMNREVKCSFDVLINVLEIDNQKWVCYNRNGANNFEIIIENQGNEDIEGVQIFLLDSGGTPYTNNSYTLLEAHKRAKYNVSLGSSFVFPPSKALISPILSVSGSSVDVCSDNRIDLEDFCECGTDDCV